jgi:hypothetical protein
MRTRRLLRTVSTIALATVALAGCGGASSNGIESKSASEIVTEALKTAESAKSVHLSGTVASSGTHVGLDMEILKGTGAKGTISEGTLTLQLIRAGENLYLKGNSEFFEHFGGPEAAKLLQGKWLKAPANSSELESLGELTDMHKLLSSIGNEHGALAKGGTSTIEGTNVIAVNDTEKGGTLYVATTGKPYPIQLSKTGSGGGKVSFTRWDEDVSISAPPASETIDLSKLSHLG